MKLLQTICAWLIAVYCLAQPSLGDKLRNEGDLEGAIAAYKKIYNDNASKKSNTYNLACAYALMYQIDSAFHYLNIALKSDNTLWSLADPDLMSLIDDTRWDDVVENQMAKYQKENGPLEEPEYALKLLLIIKKDQALDYYIDQAKKEFMKKGQAPHWYYPLRSMKQQLASSNFKELEDLLLENGWPKYSKVGKLAADAPLLVINHHENDLVRKQYIEQIKEACLSGEGSCMEYAKIQDRILVNDNLPQLYGMQFRYNKKRKLEPFPVQDPEFVDQRRAEIGLEPLSSYLQRKIDYNWNVEQKTN